MIECDKPAVSLNPCSFPNATDECPVGYITTNCVTYAGDDDQYAGLIKGELLTDSFVKLIEYIKQKKSNIASNSIEVERVEHESGDGYRLEVVPSADEGNTIILGSDGKLYGLPFSGYTYTDTNTIDMVFNPDSNNLRANLRIVQSATVNLATTSSGLKADISQSVMDRITTLETKVAQLENQ